ncbi:hypothetical protein [Ramlibacter sp. PS4R-6]|uniref:hypothetical protein n=1 Tax=Ramlibacter sp. PS4R-6 TaxID=3133438 RepID=UPI0030A84D63
MLEHIERQLASVTAQLRVAALVVEQQDMLRSGAFELRAGGRLIAVLDMPEEVAVLPRAGAADFDSAMCTRIHREDKRVPDNFARVGLAQLMWQYVLRTRHDVLPRRYRRAPIYFRRPPRVDGKLVDDRHLVVMRELALRPCTFDELRERAGLPDADLAQVLAALYFVGSVTSNPQRVGAGASEPASAGAMAP